MENIENSVAAQGQEAGAVVEQPADDAQATEISVEEVLASLNAGDEGGEETVDNEGDDGQSAQEEQHDDEQQGKEGDKFSRRIAAALKNQEQKLLSELGGGQLTKAQIAEIVNDHLARKMNAEDPEISVKAAKKILKAQQQEQTDTQTASEEQVADVKYLLSKKWTREELLAFSQDETAREEMSNGVSVRDAAIAYKARLAYQTQPTAAKKKSGAPIARRTSAGSTPEVDPIKNMNGAQYDRFMEDLKRRAMRGEKVRI